MYNLFELKMFMFHRSERLKVHMAVKRESAQWMLDYTKLYDVILFSLITPCGRQGMPNLVSNVESLDDIQRMVMRLAFGRLLRENGKTKFQRKLIMRSFNRAFHDHAAFYSAKLIRKLARGGVIQEPSMREYREKLERVLCAHGRYFPIRDK